MYETYKNAAEELGLTMSPPDPGIMTFFIDLDGVVDGRKVHVRRFVGSGGFFVVESAWETPLGAGLVLVSANLLDTLGALVGFHDLEVGDAAFDERFRIRAKDPARARALLTAEVREGLNRLGSDVKLTDGSLSARYNHHDETSELIVGLAREVSALARLLGR